MQVQKPSSRFPKRATSPLKGADSFSALMRTKPMAVWGACLVHALVKQENSLSLNTNLSNSCIELGLIVPKKVYALAVDRNRIRRILRAHCLELAQGLPCTVQILFRIKAAAKKKGLPALPLERTAQNTNPHSTEFSIAVKQSLIKALSRVQAATLNQE